MAKAPAEKIDDLPDSIKHYRINGGRTHRIVLTAKWTNGARATKNFDSFAEAAAFVAGELKLKHGAADLKLTPDELASARTALTKLGGAATLEAAVNYYFDRGPGRKTPRKMGESSQQYLRDLKLSKCKPGYIYAQSVSIGVLIKGMGDLPLHDYTTNSMLAWLTGLAEKRKWSSINLFNYYRDYRMLFDSFVEYDWLGVNPLDHPSFKPIRKSKPARDDREIQIYRVPDCRKLLAAADLNPALDLLGYFSVALFSGARVSELKKLNFDHINLRRGKLIIPSDVAAKGGNPRSPAIPPVLREWLGRVVRKHGPLVEPKNWRHRMNALFSVAGVPRKRNGLRHTMASMHYSLHEDAPGLRKILGHQCAQVLFDSYATLIDSDEAAAFWKLTPKDYPEKQARLREQSLIRMAEEQSADIDERLTGRLIKAGSHLPIPELGKQGRGRNYNLVPLPTPTPASPNEEEEDFGDESGRIWGDDPLN